MFPSRVAIVEEARSWLGTGFHHQGRLRKSAASRGGCDCIGLVMGVARALEIPYGNLLLADYDNVEYGRLPDGEMLYRKLQYYLDEIPVACIQPADILLFCFDKNPQHVGFVTDYPQDNSLGLIHCYAQVRKVVEHRLDEVWRRKIVAAFCFKKVV